MNNISRVAKNIGIKGKDIELYGKYMAKIEGKNDPKGKLILVSAMNPTTAGEGKTTVAIGICDGLNRLGKKAILSLREPSMGPVFGMKGGATGGGKAVIEPKNEINLHFTGDMHALSQANNLICAIIDNSLFQGNPLNIDPNKIYFKRCLDMNDRSLREVEISLGSLKGLVPRKESFTITAASEMMAVLCLASDFKDLKERIGKILIAHSYDGKAIYVKDLNIVDAVACLLTHAIKPNLVQTGEGNACIVHGGPFANIAHGCSSLIATRTALSYGEYCVTEGGFGGDLGGEKFMDIVCRQNNLYPSAVVIVATIKAIKLHSENGNLEQGFLNLKKHIENFKNVFKQNVIVALNHFDDDGQDEIDLVKKLCAKLKTKCFVCDEFTLGGKGCEEIAEEIIKTAKPSKPNYPYSLTDPLEQKIFDLASKVYGAGKVEYSPLAKEKIKVLEPLCKNMPIVIAKTQYSLSDDPKLIGCPKDFCLHVSDVELKNGCGFVVVKTGDIYLMPGLGKSPNALKIKVDDKLNIFNLR